MAISVSLLDYLEDEQEKNRTSEQNSREKNNIRCVAIYIRNCKFVVDSMVGLEMREIRNIINHMAAAFFFSRSSAFNIRCYGVLIHMATLVFLGFLRTNVLHCRNYLRFGVRTVSSQSFNMLSSSTTRLNRFQ